MDLYRGTTLIATATTNASGVATFTGLSASASGILYTAKATRARWVTSTLEGAVTVRCDETATVTIRPTASPGYTCQWVTCADPAPTTLYATTALGTVAINGQFPGGTLTSYTGTQSFTTTSCFGISITTDLTIQVLRDSGTGELWISISSFIQYGPQTGTCVAPHRDICWYGGGAPLVGWTWEAISSQVSIGFIWCSEIDFSAGFTTACRHFEENCGAPVPLLIEYDACITWPVTTVAIAE